MRSVTGNDAGTDKPLNQRLQKQLESGAVSVSSADVANFDGKAKDKSAPTDGDVSVPAPPMAKRDPVMEAANEANSAEQLQDDIEQGEKTRSALHEMTTGNAGGYGTVVLTHEEREAFIDSLISGERYEQDFSLYGGQLKGTFRARSQAETIAVIRWLNYQRRTEEITDMLEYATQLRNVLLAAQVKSLNGDEFPPLQEPLHRTVKGKDDVTEPGWLPQAALWADRQEGLNAAVYNELRNFEKKYWAMVDGAEDQNFLNPEEST